MEISHRDQPCAPCSPAPSTLPLEDVMAALSTIQPLPTATSTGYSLFHRYLHLRHQRQPEAVRGDPDLRVRPAPVRGLPDLSHPADLRWGLGLWGLPPGGHGHRDGCHRSGELSPEDIFHADGEEVL